MAEGGGWATVPVEDGEHGVVDGNLDGVKLPDQDKNGDYDGVGGIDNVDGIEKRKKCKKKMQHGNDIKVTVVFFTCVRSEVFDKTGIAGIDCGNNIQFVFRVGD